MDKKLTADCVQNIVEDLIPAEKLIKEVMKVPVHYPVTLVKEFMTTYTQESVLKSFMQAL